MQIKEDYTQGLDIMLTLDTSTSMLAQDLAPNKSRLDVAKEVIEWFMSKRTSDRIGTVIFAAAHYVRSVKRYWTFPGHVALGALLCAAFYWTGNVWLSFGVHAGGVLVLMAVRPVVRYTGPAWLVGASIFPYAGAVGIAALVLLTVNMWLVYGGVR